VEQHLGGEKMASSTLEQELLGLEKRFWSAIKDADYEAALALTDDPCIVAGPSGVMSVDKKAFKSMMEGATSTMQDFKIDPDVQVLKPVDDVALVAYKVTEHITVDGKPVTLNAADASTWVRKNGRWLCAMHSESVLGDPYGRDKKS
jgi:ketosteroid isomerase-like protein